MTTPGGDDGEAAKPQAPVATARPGFDGIGLLAWGAAIAFAVALAAVPVLLFKFGPLRPVLDDWRIAITLPESEPEQEAVQPLSGRPPETSGHRRAREGAVIGNPSWIVRPQAEYPRLAMKRRVTAGRVELQCPVTAEGTIASCWILNETPPGAGFGQAAVTAAAHARLKPRTVDGVPTPGMVRFSTNFRLP